MQDVQHLFPGFRENRIYEDGKAYIENELVKMIEDGEFYLTALMLQPEADAIGEIIFGQAIDESTHKNTLDRQIPPQIEDFRVKLESIEWTGEDTFKKSKAKLVENGIRSADNLMSKFLVFHFVMLDRIYKIFIIFIGQDLQDCQDI